jgi:hypothetical protein
MINSKSYLTLTLLKMGKNGDGNQLADLNDFYYAFGVGGVQWLHAALGISEVLPI